MITESRSVDIVGLSAPGENHTFSVERTKGNAAMRSMKVVSLQDTVTKLSHFPTTTIFTPCLRISSIYLRHTGRSVESIGRFCFLRRSIAFSDRNFSGRFNEYSVAALSFKLMRYFNESCCADTPVINRMKAPKRNNFLILLLSITYLFSAITKPMPRWEAINEPPTTRLPI